MAGFNIIDGLFNANSVGLSGDGKQVYVVGADNAIAIFHRDLTTGILSYAESVNGNQDAGINNGTIAISPDNTSVYVSGFSHDVVSLFAQAALPTTTVPSDQNFCHQDMTSLFEFSSNLSTTLFKWTNNNPIIGLIGSGKGAIPSFLANNPSDGIITATISVQPYVVGPNGQDDDGTGDDIVGISQSFNINILPTPTPANAGVDQLDVCGVTATLAANFPLIGTGMWHFVSGTASLSDATIPNPTITGVIGEEYVLEWAITNNNACPTSKDQVRISFDADTDNDTVQDCEDVCEGSDDRIDTDNSGIPDACECDALPSSLELTPQVFNNALMTTTFNNSLLIKARQIINATMEVAPHTTNYPTVLLEAGNEITLKAGFHAKAGSEFLARITACSNNTQLYQPTTTTSKPSISNTSFSMKVAPNPIEQFASIEVGLPMDAPLIIYLYNQQGQKIKTCLPMKNLTAGTHFLTLDVSNFPKGLYLLQAYSHHKKVITQKIVIQ